MAVIAFIPVRGGSKSIPLKNIRMFCGYPLVYWSVKAAVNASFIDSVIVATDSTEIKNVVNSFNFPKVVVYDRKPDNAMDTSSTESVMLEYLKQSEMNDSDVFILIQATSPMLSAADLEGGFNLFVKNDSVLSVVRNKRFFWTEDGRSLNYDYKQRPLRQNFSGNLMENGAFYINTVKNILSSGNRLTGKIGVYEMPEFTAFEIDEPDDWYIMEHLMNRHILKKQNYKNEIKLVLSDVDGVLTDCGMYYSESGDELKKFNTQDGMGFQLLREAGVKTGIITSEETDIVMRRAQKLKVDFLVQNAGKYGGKLSIVQKICQDLGIDLINVAYIGDDINCKDLLSNVGVAACPSNAVSAIKQIPGILQLPIAGGSGAFRYFVDIILER